MTMEREFEYAKEILLCNLTLKKLHEYNATLDEVDIPEFCKPLNEQPLAIARGFVERIIQEKRVNECLLNYME